MPTAMSAKQIAQVAYNAGWRGEQLVIATAVGLAESGGRYWVVNSIGCVGLWQINVPVHKKYTTAAMKDPAKNAAAAMDIYKGAGSKWSPWEAYTGPDGRGSDGPYSTQMGRARIAAASIKGSSGVSVDPASTSGGGGGGGIIDAAYQDISGGSTAVPANWITDFLMGVTGGNLIEGGINSVGGPLIGIGKALLAISIAVTRGAAWLANPRNWLRVVEVIGGGVVLFIGLKMLAGSGVDSPVTAVARGAVKTASVATTAATGGTGKVAKAATAVKGLK